MTLAQDIQNYLTLNCNPSKTGKKWRTRSPLRTDSQNASVFSVTFIDDTFGIWKDFSSGEGGTLYDLAPRIGIPLPERVQVDSTKREYTDLASYAQAHGVDEKVFCDAGWYNTEKNGRRAIAFKTKNGTRYRFLDDGAQRYTNDTGYKTCWYGLSRAVQIAKEKRLPLILCNGEASTVVAQHYGLPACAKSNGEAKLPDDLLRELKEVWSGQVAIALDCDETGRRVSAEIHEQIENSVLIDLKLSDGGDLADWCRIHTTDAVQDFTALIPEKSTTRKTTENMVSERLRKMFTATLTPGAIRGLRTNMPSVDKALSGLVGGRVVCLYGDTGMGKSTLCASWSVELGRQAPGLIFSTEISAEAYLDKLACAHARVPFNKLEDGLLTPDEIKKFERAYTELAGMTIEFEDMAQNPDLIVPRVLAAQQAWGCGWVVIDSLSKIAEGVEYERVTAAANAVQQATTQSGLPVIVTSQIGRNLKMRSNKVPTLHDAQGSGMIEQNADVVLALYNHNYYVQRSEAEPDDRYPPGTTALVCLKDRWRGNTGKGWRITNVGGAAFFETSHQSTGVMSA